MNKKIFVFYGPGGSGKNTIVNTVYGNVINFMHNEGFNSNDMELLVPITTRDPRPEEINGKDYIFMKEESEEFQSLLNDKSKQITSYKYHIIDNEGDGRTVHYIYPYPTTPFSILIGNLSTVYKLLTDKNIKLEPKTFYITAMKETLLYRLITREIKRKNPNIREVARRFISDLKDFSTDNDNLYRNLILPPSNHNRYDNDFDFRNGDLDDKRRYDKLVIKITSEIIESISKSINK